MKMSLRTLIVGGLKLALSGALICAIAWCFVTFDSPKGDVEKADAHILALNTFAPLSKNQKFMTMLRDWGLEKPRAYDWNGNSVYYSMGSTKLTPLQFLSSFQHQLVDKGINKHVHTRIPKSITQSMADAPAGQKKQARTKAAVAHFERADDFFTGGLVPINVAPNHVAMAGAISKKKAKGALDFALEMIKGRQSLPATVGQMRYVEAWRNPGDSKTTIAAVWSDDKLDMRKFAPDAKRSDLGVDPSVPVCLGCRRRMRFAGEGKEDGYSTNVFVSRQNVQQVADFYDRALRHRGWKLAKSSRVTRLLKQRGVIPPTDGKLSSFAKGGQFLTVVAYPIKNGRTEVHVFASP